MRLTIRALASIAVLSAAVGLPAASMAQAPSQGAAAPPDAGARARWAGRMHEHAAARAKALHDILNIRPDQDAAFQAFIASMTPPEGQGGPREHKDWGEMKSLTTPERLDRMAARMADRAAAFQRHAAAVKAFYAALSPEQQRAFDALQQLRGFGRDRGEGRGGPDRGGPPGHEG